MLSASSMHLFFTHSSQLGWFLHTDRFRSAALLPTGHLDRPIPLLISTVCLWAIAISTIDSNDVYPDREHALLARVRSALGMDLSKATPHQILQVIQAKVLFATYLFHMGDLIEGRHHCDSAAAAVMACGLHKIRSNEPLTPDDALDAVSITLPEPMDSVEEGTFNFCSCLLQQAEHAARRALERVLDGFFDGQVLGRCPPDAYHHLGRRPRRRSG